MSTTYPAASLMGLPSEIRQIINKFLLPKVTEVKISLDCEGKTCYLRGRYDISPDPTIGAGLMRVCKTTREEFGSRLYTKVRFTFRIDTAMTFIRNLAPEFRCLITQIGLSLHYDSVDQHREVDYIVDGLKSLLHIKCQFFHNRATRIYQTRYRRAGVAGNLSDLAVKKMWRCFYQFHKARTCIHRRERDLVCISGAQRLRMVCFSLLFLAWARLIELDTGVGVGEV
jgi:hypothetical protein